MSSVSDDEDRWKAAALAGLAGKPLESLTGVTAEGIPLEPLYLARHVADMVLGNASVVGARRASRATIAQRIEVADAEAAASQAEEALAGGATALWLVTKEAERLERVLKSVGKSVPILLDAGTRAAALDERAASQGFTNVSALFDPFGAALRSWGLDVPLEGALDMSGGLVRDAEVAAEPFAARALAVSAADVVEAGGHGAHAIGYALAAGLELLRRLESRAIEPAKIAAQIAIVVAPGTDVFHGIAFLRALRVTWAKLLAAVGASGAGAPLVVGTTSRRALAQLDRPTNMIRVALETFALLAGGADVVAPRAFDEVSASPSPLGRRLARNTALVLALESHIGRVVDPAAGSFYVESLTDRLARAGWEEMRTIEREGGLLASLGGGRFQQRVEDAKTKRAAEIAKRKRVLVGVNDFAPPGAIADPLTPEELSDSTRVWPLRALVASRDAEAFEELRGRAHKSGKARRASLVLVGDAAAARVREGFSRRFFEAAGFEVETVDAPPAKADVVVICGTDAAYQSSAADAVAAAKKAGAREIVLAGKPGALEDALKAQGLTSSIHAGADLPALATSILGRLEASR